MAFIHLPAHISFHFHRKCECASQRINKLHKYIHAQIEKHTQRGRERQKEKETPNN